MFLFEFLIKILIGNSDTLFVALFMAIFGYYGWLLWHVNENLNDFLEEWAKHGKKLEDLKSQIEDLDESVYRELILKLDSNIKECESLLKNVESNSDNLDRVKRDIISEVKESVDEVKDIILLMMNNRLRSKNPNKENQNKCNKENTDTSVEE